MGAGEAGGDTVLQNGNFDILDLIWLSLYYIGFIRKYLYNTFDMKDEDNSRYVCL
jgi:hypothetical protein